MAAAAILGNSRDASLTVFANSLCDVNGDKLEPLLVF
jgi:hypothetical protein